MQIYGIILLIAVFRCGKVIADSFEEVSINPPSMTSIEKPQSCGLCSETLPAGRFTVIFTIATNRNDFARH